MAHFEDESPCGYFGFGIPTERLRAIGWLEHGHPFPTGPVEPGFVDVLTALAHKPWTFVMCAGVHICSLCTQGKPHAVLIRSGQSFAAGAENVFVPGDGVAFVAPSLVVHYIRKHGYQPPPAFIAAVMACPAMGSPEYLDKLKAAVPELVR